MSVVPDKQSDKIEWCENRVGPWTTNAAAIGTTAPEVANFDAKTQAARAALAAAELARDVSKAATQTLRDAIAELDTAAAGIIKQVRTKAETTRNPAVYTLALIPPPATPAPVGNPGMPGGFRVALAQNGSLGLHWKCPNPANCSGVVYRVWRRTGTTGPFTYIGGTGEKQFTDGTIPAGTPQVTYEVQAVRSTGEGQSSQFTVNFGTENAPGSAATLTVTTVQPTPKMAA